MQDKELDPGPPLSHYFSVGEDAIKIIVNALVANSRQPPSSILDFPSGSGRVTRHMRAFFPEARIVAADLYASHVNFCVKQFDCEGVISNERPNLVQLPTQFDLIFCGSLLTHLPENLCVEVLDLFERVLTPTGIAIVTFQGRFSDFVQRNKWKYLDDEAYEIARLEVEKEGFGFVDYDANFRQKFNEQASYGITLVRPHWVMKQLEARPSLRILGYVERGWDDHQDVLVFGKPGIFHD